MPVIENQRKRNGKLGKQTTKLAILMTETEFRGHYLFYSSLMDTVKECDYRSRVIITSQLNMEVEVINCNNLCATYAFHIFA